jgi:hypothetical protein
MQGKAHLRSWPVSRSLATALAVALMLCCRGGAAEVDRTPSASSVPVDKTVNITVTDDHVLKVDPDVFVARLGGPGVEFVVSGLSKGYSVEIDFRVQGTWKGPFLRAKNLVRGRYEFQGGGETHLPSGAVDAKNVTLPSVWKYEVTLRKGNDDVMAIDPMGVFR